jgi:hypothetical protein
MEEASKSFEIIEVGDMWFCSTNGDVVAPGVRLKDPETGVVFGMPVGRELAKELAARLYGNVTLKIEVE